MEKNKVEIITLIHRVYNEVESQGFTRDFWNALSKLSEILFKQQEIREKYAKLDIYEYIKSIPTKLKKSMERITNEELYSQILHLSHESSEWNCYIPLMGLSQYPKGYILGNGRLINSGDIPEDIKNNINYHSLGELPSITFLVTKVITGGPHKAMELAEKQAIEAVGILQTVYNIDLKPPGRPICKNNNRIMSSYYEPKVPYIEEFNPFITILNGEISGNNDLSRRFLTTISLMGLRSLNISLPLKLLLSVSALEALLLSPEDKDYLGLKLREKIALLIGGSKNWIAIFLNIDQIDNLSSDLMKANLVQARKGLAEKVKDLYDKRSGISHGGEVEVTEEDSDFSVLLVRLVIRKLLELREKQQITCIKRTKFKRSLDDYLDEIIVSNISFKNNLHRYPVRYHDRHYFRGAEERL